jgi:hypothetical protein
LKLSLEASVYRQKSLLCFDVRNDVLSDARQTGSVASVIVFVFCRICFADRGVFLFACFEIAVRTFRNFPPAANEGDTVCGCSILSGDARAVRTSVRSIHNQSLLRPRSGGWHPVLGIEEGRQRPQDWGHEKGCAVTAHVCFEAIF